MLSRKSRLALAELYAKAFGIPDHTIPEFIWADMDNEDLYDFLYANEFSEKFCDAARKHKYPSDIKEFMLRFDESVISEPELTVQDYLRKLAEDVLIHIGRFSPTEYYAQNNANEVSALLHALEGNGYIYRNHKIVEEKAAEFTPEQFTTQPNTVRDENLISTLPITDSLTGRVLHSKYQIMEALGKGGMGTVYRARRLELGDDVAIKVLKNDLVINEATLTRFKREAQAAALLKHPNIVSIYDIGAASDNGAPVFIVMELVPGESLKQLLKRTGKINSKRAIYLMRGICSAVGTAHKAGVIHRDIKPDNIMVVPPHSEHENESVKVLDFGLAKLHRRDSALGQTITQPGVIMGTPMYMSPEQFRGESLDARSDVYSLGVTLYEMLSGAPPFTDNNYAGLAAKHLYESPLSLSPNLGVAKAVDAVIIRALAKDPEARQADATEFLRDLLIAEETEQGTKSTKIVNAKQNEKQKIDPRLEPLSDEHYAAVQAIIKVTDELDSIYDEPPTRETYARYVVKCAQLHERFEKTYRLLPKHDARMMLYNMMEQYENVASLLLGIMESKIKDSPDPTMALARMRKVLLRKILENNLNEQEKNVLVMIRQQDT